MDKVIENLFWIVVGVVLTRLLDKPFERWQRRIGYSLKRFASRFRDPKADLLEPADFRVGKWHTKWVVVEGSSRDPYTPNNVICQYDPTEVIPPPELQLKINEIEKEQSTLEKAEGRLFTNGPTVALAGIERGQTGDLEEPILLLRVRPSRYYMFLATSHRLDEPIQMKPGTTTIRDKYLRNLNFASPIVEFGVNPAKDQG